jgi:hypothetical protein
MNPLQERVKRDNTRRIVDLIRRRDGIAQRDLVTETGLRASTVSNLVRELRDGGIVRTVGIGASGSNGGKPPVIVGLEPGRGAYVGLLWNADTIASCITDFAGAPVGAIEKLPIPPEWRDPTSGVSILDLLLRQAGQRIEEIGKDAILGVGLSVGSIVDNGGNIIASADFPWSVEVAHKIIAATLALPNDIPILVENDANSVALDARRALPEIPETILGIVVTDSLQTTGAGIMVHDRLVRGWSGSTGELIDPTGPLNTPPERAETTPHPVETTPKRVGATPKHPLGEIDRICAATVRFIDPDFVAFAAPLGLELAALPHTTAALRDRPYRWSEQTPAALYGAAYLAHRAGIDQIIGGGVTNDGR